MERLTKRRQILVRQRLEQPRRTGWRKPSGTIAGGRARMEKKGGGGATLGKGGPISPEGREDSEEEEPSVRQRSVGIDPCGGEPEDPVPPEPKLPKKPKAKKKEREQEKEREKEKEEPEGRAMGPGDRRGPGWAKVDRTTASWLLLVMGKG